jgi:hypothetical protein
MARFQVGIKADFGRFQWERDGYAAVASMPGVQRMVSDSAESTKKAADAALSEGGYSLPGHEVKDFQGKLAPGKVVRTKTDQARYTQAKRKSLTKALGSAKGA